MNDKIRSKSKEARRINGQFYSYKELVQLTRTLFDIENYNSILEPSAGDGAFIDNFIDYEKNYNMYKIDLERKTFEYLSKKYVISNTNVMKRDFLRFNKYYMQKYYLIVGNPPFNLSSDVEFSIELCNSTDKFLFHALNMLNPNGSLVFFLPGTIFRNKSYENIIKYIITN